MRTISTATSSLSAAFLKATALQSSSYRHVLHHHRLASFSFDHQRRSLFMLRPSHQHPLLPLPADDADDTTVSPPLDIKNAFLKANINKVAFIRHGNTGPSTVDFDRRLTELGRSQSRTAGASYGIHELYPYYEKTALCSSAPRCVESAELFLDSSLRKLNECKEESSGTAIVMPPLQLCSQLYDGTMQPGADGVWKGYAPLRQYLEHSNEDDLVAAKCILGEYARIALGIIWDVVKGTQCSEEGSTAKTKKGRGTTLLVFAHAVYLPSAALGFAAAIGCGNDSTTDDNGGGIDFILDTNTKEVEGFCVHVDRQSVSLLQRPETE